MNKSVFSFLDEDKVQIIREQFGTPVFVYDQRSLQNQAQAALNFPSAFGVTVRYAMKACPNAGVVRIINRMGVHVDASSGWEVHRALKAGVKPDEIMMTAQQLPDDFEQLVSLGVRFNACSLHQLASFGHRFPGSEVGVRFNPGLGSGHSNRTNVGGPSSSFGIWHDLLGQVEALQREHDLRITLLHTHIGSGSDPEVWQRCARLTLNIATSLPEVTTVSLGGGYKIARIEGETSTDLAVAGKPVVDEFRRFANENNRELHLEIEPGTFFVANAGVIVCSVVDVVNTGKEGYSFIKTDSGMTEILRPSMYGAQHPISVVPANNAHSRGSKEYLVVGHCCESGDILTPESNNPEGLQTRTLTEAHIGDAVVIGGSGAYCASMATKNYNSFPEAPEVLLDENGDLHLLRQRQTLDQVIANEAIPKFL